MKYLFLIALFSQLFCSNVYCKESRVAIAVIDTGITPNSALIPFLCHPGQVDLTSTTLRDEIGHGTAVAGLITQNLDRSKYCIISVKVWTKKHSPHATGYIIQEAINFVQLLYNISYINISLSGNNYDRTEFEAIKIAANKGIVIVISAGNKGENLDKKCDVFPACYGIKGVYVVGALEHGVQADYSNYGKVVNAWASGDTQCVDGFCINATSAASANFLNFLLKRNTK